MKVGNIVIVANLGELKVYEAMPRDLEAEAGVKPTNVKLDLVDEKRYSQSHQKLQEILTDQAGRFKGGGQGRGTFTHSSIGERHTIDQQIEEDVLRELSTDISEIITKKSVPVHLAMPDMIFKRVMDRISPEAKQKVVKTVEKDLMKVSKMELPELF